MASFLFLLSNVKDMANFIDCSLNLNEIAVIIILREARGRGFSQIDRDIYQQIADMLDADEGIDIVDPEMVPDQLPFEIVPDQLPIEIVDLTDEEIGMPDVNELICRLISFIHLLICTN